MHVYSGYRLPIYGQGISGYINREVAEMGITGVCQLKLEPVNEATALQSDHYTKIQRPLYFWWLLVYMTELKKIVQ